MSFRQFKSVFHGGKGILKEANKEEGTSILDTLRLGNICWTSCSRDPQLEPLLPLHFRKRCLDMSDRLARKTWQKFICFRGWRTLQKKKKKNKTWENKNSFQTGPRLSFTCFQTLPLDVCLDPMKTKRPQMKRGLPKTISYHSLWVEEPRTLVIQPKEPSAVLGRWLNPWSTFRTSLRTWVQTISTCTTRHRQAGI